MMFYFTRTPTTMFHCIFISHVQAALFFNTLKPLNNSESVKNFISGFYFGFVSCSASDLLCIDCYLVSVGDLKSY